MNEPIASYAVTRRLLQQHGLSAKKGLGQNFLTDPHVLKKIIEAADIGKDDWVIEIGPGIGGLTQALAEAAGKVTAVEIDRSLIPVLTDNLAEYPHVNVIHSDALKIDWPALLSENPLSRIKAVANLPYNISTTLIMSWLEARAPFSSITVMVQKEVADRMRALPGSKDYGALSLAVQYHATVYYAANVPRHCFLPRPNVDSSVIRLTIRQEPGVSVRDEAFLFQIIKAAFGQRRKTLVNCLHHLGPVGLDKDALAIALADCGFSSDIRGEALSLADFGRLANRLWDGA